MWRPLRHVTQKGKGLQYRRQPKFSYATSPPNSSGSSSRKVVVALLTTTGLGAGAAIAYGKYDPKFRKIVEDNVPYSHVLFRSLPDWEQPQEKSTEPIVMDKKAKDLAIESSLLKKKQERLKKEEQISSEVKSQNQTKAREDKQSEPIITPVRDTDVIGLKSSVVVALPTPIIDESTVIENTIKELTTKLEKSTNEAISSQDAAIEAIQSHRRKLYQALDAPGDAEQIWKQADDASIKEDNAISSAKQKTSAAQILLKNLKSELKKGRENDALSKSSIVHASEDAVVRLEKVLTESESKVSAAQAQSKTATEYKDLVNKAREQFRNELKVVLPKYSLKNKDIPMTEDDFNLLIAHAHRRIEYLQKELARQMVFEKERADKVMLDTTEEKRLSETEVVEEIARRQREMEAEFQSQVNSIHEEFEADLRQQLRRQAAAHADHLQEALQMQHQELDRRHNLELENKLLQEKGVFISEISGSMAKLKGIESYLKARTRLNEAARKTQALWVACQAMKNAITSGFSEEPKPLGKELAVIKKVAGDESLFVTTILSGIPLQAIERGIYTDEYLKHRFHKVKQICRRVAMVDDSHRSLYRYILSYFQSLLILERSSIPQAEIENKVAVDPSEWDTFDILNRISYCLQRNDMLQALRYANQLRGEPRNVAKTWISELRLLLETSQAIDCLMAYSSAVAVQAYH